MHIYSFKHCIWKEVKRLKKKVGKICVICKNGCRYNILVQLYFCFHNYKMFKQNFLSIIDNQILDCRDIFTTDNYILLVDRHTS